MLSLLLVSGTLSADESKPSSQTEAKKPAAKPGRTKRPPPPPPKNWLIGFELRSYRYNEPNVVTHSGLLYGVWGEWAFSSFAGDGRLYGNLLYGTIDYDGSLCDASNNCTPYKAGTNDIITKSNLVLDLKLGRIFTVYGGAGFRFLSDKGQGTGFYQRTGNWAYAVLGLGTVHETSIGKWIGNVEVNYVFYGTMKSSLSEASSTLPDIVHNQASGFGYTLSEGLQFNDRWSVHLFYDVWSLKVSDAVDVGNITFTEPESTSTSFGVKLGYHF